MATSFIPTDDAITTGYTETVTQQIDAMRTGANGAIVIDHVGFEGDDISRLSFKEVANLVSRRDPTGTGTATDRTLAEMAEKAPRLSRVIGPVKATFASLRSRGRNFNADTVGMALGQQIAVAELADQLNTAAAAAVGASLSEAAANHDYSGTGQLDSAGLNKLMSLAGDTASDIRALLMHSTDYHNLIGKQIQPANSPDKIGAVTLQGGGPATFGKPVFVTDSPSLTQRVVALKPGALRITVDNLPQWLVDAVTGEENLAMRYQGEFDYTVHVGGYGYQVGAGGLNPTDAVLAAGANWDLASTTVKHGCVFSLQVAA